MLSVFVEPVTKSVKNMTPQEAWSGYKPNVAHL
jgi:hypothetical protein